MRGIILAGGTGSRLGPLTKVVNKHLLPVGGEPMIFHPLRVLLNNNITDITVVSSPSGVGQLAALLGSGHEHHCTFTYRVQDQPGGIAQALMAAKHSGKDYGGETLAVILGDNIFAEPPRIWPEEMNARCFLSRVDNVERLRSFGVPVFAPIPHHSFGGGRTITRVEEKPVEPKSEYAVTGLYVFGAGVWDMLSVVKPGARGELEMTDLLDLYARAGDLRYTVAEGFWGDAGTIEGMAECSKAVQK